MSSENIRNVRFVILRVLAKREKSRASIIRQIRIILEQTLIRVWSDETRRNILRCTRRTLTHAPCRARGAFAKFTIDTRVSRSDGAKRRTYVTRLTYATAVVTIIRGVQKRA